MDVSYPNPEGMPDSSPGRKSREKGFHLSLAGHALVNSILRFKAIIIIKINNITPYNQPAG